MVEKVVKNNFFHHFRKKKNFLRNLWKKWKKLSKPTFSTSQAVLEAQIVEKIVFDNFFHHFYDSKDFLRNSWKKGKSCQKRLFPRFGPPKRLESWRKFFLATFFTISMISKDFLKNSWKKWSKPTACTTQAVLEAQIVEKVVFDNFFHHFYDSKDFLNNSWKSGKSCQNQLFPRLKPFWRPKSWKKFVLTTFSAIFMIPKTSPTIRGKSGKSWPGQHFPR